MYTQNHNMFLIIFFWATLLKFQCKFCFVLHITENFAVPMWMTSISFFGKANPPENSSFKFVFENAHTQSTVFSDPIIFVYTANYILSKPLCWQLLKYYFLICFPIMSTINCHLFIFALFNVSGYSHLSKNCRFKLHMTILHCHDISSHQRLK